MTLFNISTVFAPVIFNTGAEDESKDTGSRTNLSNIFARKDGSGLEDKAREIDTLVLVCTCTTVCLLIGGREQTCYMCLEHRLQKTPYDCDIWSFRN